ncbi:leucine-rich repeat and IQ domain-containing protein 3 [Osmerus mordax]|uniref:leucine-rich repeat and IQ domain-containing protein 3 n=1 Tax=Osmerus mordax TaxID=8014 RepID=UPI00350F5774
MNSVHAQKAYLVTCSESFILSHGQGLNQEERETDIQHIVVVRLNHLLLRDVENIECCKSLKICILADNFISNIDSLIECVHLVKLDLRGNQITQLPNGVFWDSLKRLQLLYLHDNNVATRKNIQGLANCQNLTALTLYDTPLSLKANYRHCIVNSIWSLKALDNYVISDEEIIENWCLPFRFKSLNPHFYLNTGSSSQTESYRSEMQTIHNIISAINRIQSLHSPTLIIQRYIRGYLTRKRFRLPSATVVLCRGKIRIQSIDSAETTCEVKVRSKANRGEHWVKECHIDKQMQMQKEGDMKIKRLNVNLKRLTTSPEDFHEETSFASQQFRKKDLCPLYNSLQQSKIIKPTRIKHVEGKGLLGQEPCFQGELGNWSFWVHGFKARFHQCEQGSDMLNARHQAGQDIRRSIHLFHSQHSEPPVRPHPRPSFVTAEQRLMGRCHGSISFAPFQVIERAYETRERTETLRKRAEHVIQCQSRREGARDYRLYFLDSLRTKVLQQKENEQAQMEGALNHLKACQDREIQAVRQKHAGFIEEKRRRASEWALVTTFNGQHTSLARVINKNNMRQRQHDKRQEKRVQVDSKKMQAQSKKKLIQENQEDRKRSVKDAAITSRVNRDTHLAIKHNHRLLQAQARVASVKTKHYKRVLQPLPVNPSL